MSHDIVATRMGTERLSGWDQFWFSPAPIATTARLRGWLCLVTACFFLSSFSDVATWFRSDGGLLSVEQVQSILITSGLESEARYILSPLFLTGAPWVYQAWLLIGISLCVVVAWGRGGRIAAALAWVTVVGWANRSMMISGLGESLLSMAWLAATIAPPASAWTRDLQRHWSARLSLRLVGLQGTIVGVAMFATMLAGRVWWNGTGAFALTAPIEDRYFDGASWLVRDWVHESLTHLIVLALPIGMLLAWRPSTERLGKVMLLVWCVVVAILSSNFIYLSAFAVLVCGMGSGRWIGSQAGQEPA